MRLGGIGLGHIAYHLAAKWQRAGVWDELHALLLARLRAAGEIDFSRAVADSSHVQAKKGAPRRGRARSTVAARARGTTCSSTPPASRSPAP